MHDRVRQCEQEVEASRAKLARDLAVLRSAETFESFTDGLKQDAIETKDRLVDQAKDAVNTTVNGIIDDLKAKAAANPAAALLIAAGVGWHFLRHPPITTALVGVGLFSLLRTQASPQPQAQVSDYLRQGQERLKKQAAELASQAAEQMGSMAAHASEMLVGTSSEIVAAAKEKSGELLETAKDSMTRLQHDTRDRVAMLATASNAASSLSDQAADAAERVSEHVSGVWDSKALTDAKARDRLLLGMAGLAVAAALGFACQKRLAEDPGVWHSERSSAS